MLGIVALALAETAAAEVLLAVFMASILIVWAVELMDHAGILPGRPPDGTAVPVTGRVHRQPPGWRGAACWQPLATVAFSGYLLRCGTRGACTAAPISSPAPRR